MAEIPAELILEILLLVPVVDLLRFRCVSKKWRNLIDSPDFVKSHLNLSKKADSVMIFYEKPCAYYVDFDSVCNDISLPNLKEVTKPWGVDLCKHFDVVGICNGLLCIHTTDLGVVLWNPLTGKHVRVPQPQHPNIVVPWFWGFGYDSDSDDHKVVAIAYSNSANDRSERFVVWVYSLMSGLWKSIGDFPYFLLRFKQEIIQGQRCFRGFRQNGAFVNGALHWRVRPHSEPDGPDLIAALHLGKLGYSLVPQPDYRDNGVGKRLHLGVLDGCLFATSYDYRSEGFDLWVMMKYGVKESWTRLITCTGYACPLIPLAYTEHRNELFLVTDSNVIVRYELKTRSFKRMIRCWSPDLGKPLVYIPSLVCPRSGVFAGNSQVILDDIAVEDTTQSEEL